MEGEKLGAKAERVILGRHELSRELSRAELGARGKGSMGLQERERGLEAVGGSSHKGLSNLAYMAEAIRNKLDLADWEIWAELIAAFVDS